MDLSQLKQEEFNKAFRRWSILVVEPISKIEQKIEKVLTAARYDVNSCKSLEGARRFLEKEDVDVLVIDFDALFTDQSVEKIGVELQVFESELILGVCRDAYARKKLNKVGIDQVIIRPITDMQELKRRVGILIDRLEDS